MHVDTRAANVRDLVSVIVPAYNRGSVITGTLDSVWQQHYRPLEVVVVDDGSTDDTADVTEHWGSALPADRGFSVRCHRQRHQGVSAARNVGWQMARGELIQFLDSDDAIMPAKLTVQREALKSQPTAAASICRIAYLDSQGRPRHVSEVPDGREPTALFLMRHDIPVHAPLFRRDWLMRSGGFDEALPCEEDVEFHLRLALMGAEFTSVHQVLGNVPSRRDNQRTSQRRYGLPDDFEYQFYRKCLEQHRSSGRVVPGFQEALAARLLGIARREFSHGRIRRGRYAMQASLEALPRTGVVADLYSLPGMGWVAVGIEWTRRTLVRLQRATRRKRDADD